MAAGGARKKKGFPAAGQGSPRSEMQHSRFRTNRSARRANPTTSGATSDRGAVDRSRSATPRPSIVSPASASSTSPPYAAPAVPRRGLVQIDQFVKTLVHADTGPPAAERGYPGRPE